MLPRLQFAPEQGDDTNPVLTDRRNVVVVADEAHRSQYGFSETLSRTSTLKAGLAKHAAMRYPAPFLGFTGTPIEIIDRQVDPGGLRRLHRRLRPDPRGRGRRHSQDLLRITAGQGHA